ncbi:MAG: SMC-Scp complex subunit ScpB [Caldisericaceae bacterium]
MKKEEYLSAIEAILFVSSKPLKLSSLSEALSLDTQTTRNLVSQLDSSLKERGFVLQIENESYSLIPNEKFRRYYEKFIRKKHQPFSRELLEVIAILVKGRQTKDYINKLRGVNSTRSINSLLRRGYVSKEFIEGSIYYSLTENCLRLINPDAKKKIKNPSLFNVEKK